MTQHVGEKHCYSPPPANSHEYQKKRLTEFAFRKWLILKEAILVVLEEQNPKWLP